MSVVDRLYGVFDSMNGDKRRALVACRIYHCWRCHYDEYRASCIYGCWVIVGRRVSGVVSAVRQFFLAVHPNS